MATTHTPLLIKPNTSHRRFLYLVLSLLAILVSTSLVTIHVSNFSYFDPPELTNVCDHVQNKTSCLATIYSITLETSNKTTHLNLLQVLLRKSASEMESSIRKTTDLVHVINDREQQAALTDCVELMELSIDRIIDSLAKLESVTIDSHATTHTWLSSVLTNHDTCLDELKRHVRSTMEAVLEDLILKSRTSLAILVAMSPPNKVTAPLRDNFPSWLTKRDRKMLESVAGNVKADVIVAKDGSGNYETLKEAVASVPDHGKTRYVIYVKKGTYEENVEVGKKKKNVMIIGDGMDSTIVTGCLNVVDGSTTFKSATLAAVGDGFVLQDIWIQNTAGPEKHQAVALRVGADQSVINRCRIDAYQDTLYAHSNRQFYRDNFITGTVDFIFGNAAVVFQNSTIVARKPMIDQDNMITAQGRTDPNQNTGTSIQQCNIIASSDLEPVKNSIKSYLGRPWKKYSRTVVMQSSIGDFIDPAGWSEWNGDFALKTLYYGEYMNTGPGANTSERVKWPGYHIITSASVAERFTVAELIQGESWLNSVGVTYTEWL